MKKLTQIVSAIVLSVAFVGLGNVASAVACTGSISITGPDSTNLIDCKDVLDVNITCENNIYVATATVQEAESGDAEGQDNTFVGDVATGTALNHNDTEIIIGVTGCGEQGEEGEGEKEEEEKAPVVVTGAEVPSAGAGAAAPQKVAALPFTAGNSTLETAAISAIVLATAFATIRLAVAAYRRQALKQ